MEGLYLRVMKQLVVRVLKEMQRYKVSSSSLFTYELPGRDERHMEGLYSCRLSVNGFAPK